MLASHKQFTFSHLAIAMLAFALFMPEPALAANDLAGMFSNMGGQATAGAKFAKILFFVIGFVMFGVGMMMFATAQKQQQPKGASITVMLIGVALMSIVGLVHIFTASSVGGTSSGLNELGL